MAARDIFERLGARWPGALRRPDGRGLTGNDGGELPDAPLGGTRAESMQRLQVGVTSLAVVVLMVGLASIIGGVADQAEEDAVPDASPTTEPTAPPPQRDPLADAGVVPDIAVEPEAPMAPRPEGSDDSVTAPDGTVFVPDTPPTDSDGQSEEQSAPGQSPPE